MGAVLFFFGTLRHQELLEAVLGQTQHLVFSDASLPNHEVCAVEGHAFPLIRAQAGSSASGVVARGATRTDFARLDFYEKIFDYSLKEVSLADGSLAQVYVPPEDRWVADGPWSIDIWKKTWSEMSVLAAREAMAHMGRKTPSDLAAMWPNIQARASSSLRAAISKHGFMTHKGVAEIAQRFPVYAKYFALDEFHVRHSQFDGSQSDWLDRAIFRPPDAALVLPYDPVRDRVLLVEQIRMGPLIRGDKTLWQLEPIAGHIDAGETPQEAARREALEEANIVLDQLETVAECYPSPGNSTEFFYVFVAPVALPEEAAGMGGLDAEAEDIRSHLVPFEALMSYADSMQLANSPLLIAAYWLARHRERLRTSGSA
ncbi:MAG: NUDIX domain-containing protein [Pseudomonadota bacterium]